LDATSSALDPGSQHGAGSLKRMEELVKAIFLLAYFIVAN
jgi:hypothetical protein